MNKIKIVFSALLLVVASSSAHADFKTLAEREANILQSYRQGANAEDLVILANIREERGKYGEALQTLALLRKTFGTSGSRAYADDEVLTYNQLANWMAKRIAAKRRGIRRAPAATRRAAELAYARYYANDKTLNATLVDLNGDGLEEMVSYIDFGRKLRVHIWNGGMWDSVWQSKDNANISDDYLITGGEGQGWPAVFIDYLRANSPNPDSGHLMTNGDSWIVIYN